MPLDLPYAEVNKLISDLNGTAIAVPVMTPDRKPQFLSVYAKFPSAQDCRAFLGQLFERKKISQIWDISISGEASNIVQFTMHDK